MNRMGANPDICPNCSEKNTFNLDYCTVCGLRFQAKRVAPVGADPTSGPAKKKSIDPATLKVMKKKRTLLTAFREGRISEEKLRKGLRDLGGSEEVERALDLKRFLEEQIKNFEQMDLSGQREGYFPDHDTPQSDLPRDENGAPITDFRASAEDRDYFTKGRPFETISKAEGASLFKRVGAVGKDPRTIQARAIATSRSMTRGAQTDPIRRTVRSSGVNWDEDDDEDIEGEDWGEEEEGDDDFEIELDEGPSSDDKHVSDKGRKTSVEWLDDDDEEDWGTTRARKRRDLK